VPSTSQAYRAYSARPFKREERGQVEILFGGLHWRAEKVIQAAAANPDIVSGRCRPPPRTIFCSGANSPTSDNAARRVLSPATSQTS